MQEIWKDIKGFEGSYQVSDLGNVRSLPRLVEYKSHCQIHKGRILKPQLNSKGYLRVRIGGKSWFVHRLVAEAFIENPDNKAQVNHKDGCKQNNAANNLEWNSNLENRKHAVVHSLHKVTIGEERTNAKLTEDDVRWIRQHYKKGCRIYGRKPLAKKFGVSHQTIKNIIDYKKWKHVQ